jgi:hypothetical protein
MPSGPPEEHEFFTNLGPTNCADQNAIQFLQKAGYVLTNRWEWFNPPEKHATDEEYRAVRYLCLEWDFGGFTDYMPPPVIRPQKGFLFRHKKGGIYLRLSSNVFHTETEEDMTLYVHIWPHHPRLYVRPTIMFDELGRFDRLKMPKLFQPRVTL